METGVLKIGIIQMRGAGDVVIALPIAKFLYSRGHEIFWAVDEGFKKALEYAAPYVNWVGFSVDDDEIQGNIFHRYWYENPKEELEKLGCSVVCSFPFEECRVGGAGDLESRLQDPTSQRALSLRLAQHLTFDQFKYALAGVPFKEKWNLDIRRDPQREQDLYNQVVKKANYVVVQNVGKMGRIKYDFPNIEEIAAAHGDDTQVIYVEELTDNLFDWLLVLENASALVLIDSVYANLVDQLGFGTKKYFVRRSPVYFTPVLREEWDYIGIDLTFIES